MDAPDVLGVDLEAVGVVVDALVASGVADGLDLAKMKRANFLLSTRFLAFFSKNRDLPSLSAGQ